MRAVTTATAAIVLGVERKALDNILVRLGRDALPLGRQGIERRIPVALLETLALTEELSDGLGMRIRDAFFVARLLTTSTDNVPDANRVADRVAHRPVGRPAGRATEEITRQTPIGQYLRLDADLHRLRNEIHERLELAIENVVRRQRGRPRSSARITGKQKGAPS